MRARCGILMSALGHDPLPAAAGGGGALADSASTQHYGGAQGIGDALFEGTR